MDLRDRVGSRCEHNLRLHHRRVLQLQAARVGPRASGTVLTHNEIVLFRRSERACSLRCRQSRSIPQIPGVPGVPIIRHEKSVAAERVRYVSTNYTPCTRSRLRTRYTGVQSRLTIRSVLSSFAFAENAR